MLFDRMPPRPPIPPKRRIAYESNPARVNAHIRDIHRILYGDAATERAVERAENVPCGTYARENQDDHDSDSDAFAAGHDKL
jgi:hypothetical protein